MQDHGRCMVHPSHAMRVHLQHAREDAVYTVYMGSSFPCILVLDICRGE
jgi:hypothetical protein